MKRFFGYFLLMLLPSMLTAQENPTNKLYVLGSYNILDKRYTMDKASSFHNGNELPFPELFYSKLVIYIM